MEKIVYVGVYFECQNELVLKEEEMKGCKIHGKKRGCKFCPDCGKPVEKIKTGNKYKCFRFDVSNLDRLIESTTSIHHIHRGFDEKNKEVETVDLFIPDGFHYFFDEVDDSDYVIDLTNKNIPAFIEEAKDECKTQIEMLKEFYGEKNVSIKYGAVSIHE